MLSEGTALPPFSLAASDGTTITNETIAGRWSVIYFYPKDDTPGCTREAIGFSALVKEFKKSKVALYGISPDSVASHCRFIDKQELSIPLLSDPDRALSTACGSYGKKVLYGKESMGIIRSTFIVDPAGVIRKVWKKVSVDGHAEKVLEAVRELMH